jgi:hypothetical protein
LLRLSSVRNVLATDLHYSLQNSLIRSQSVTIWLLF